MSVAKSGMLPLTRPRMSLRSSGLRLDRIRRAMARLTGALKLRKPAVTGAAGETARACGPGGGEHGTANTRCISGAQPMTATRTRELYSSPNGDRWHLCKDASGRVFVLHQPNIPSGGQISQIELRDFLARGYGPEQQALLQMIGTLVESPSDELLTGEGNPGLAVTGGSGHA
jgi:hypothetical protein